MEPFTIGQISPISSWRLEVLVLKVHPYKVYFPRSDCPAAGGTGLFSRSSKFGIHILSMCLTRQVCGFLVFTEDEKPIKMTCVYGTILYTVLVYGQWFVLQTTTEAFWKASYVSFLRALHPRNFVTVSLNSGLCLPPAFTIKKNKMIT